MADTLDAIHTAEPTRYLLPPEAYFSAEWYEREQRDLFGRTWNLVAYEHDVPRPVTTCRCRPVPIRCCWSGRTTVSCGPSSTCAATGAWHWPARPATRTATSAAPTTAGSSPLRERWRASPSAHAVFFSTVPLVTISLGLEAIQPAVGEAATTLGAAPRQRFRTVTLPLLAPSIVTGFVAAFVLSLNEYIIAFMVAGFTVETLPIKVFNALRYGFTPTIAAVAVVFTLLSLTALSVLARLGGLERLLGADLADR